MEAPDAAQHMRELRLPVPVLMRSASQDELWRRHLPSLRAPDAAQHMLELRLAPVFYRSRWSVLLDGRGPRL